MDSVNTFSALRDSLSADSTDSLNARESCKRSSSGRSDAGETLREVEKNGRSTSTVNSASNKVNRAPVTHDNDQGGAYDHVPLGGFPIGKRVIRAVEDPGLQPGASLKMKKHQAKGHAEALSPKPSTSIGVGKPYSHPALERVYKNLSLAGEEGDLVKLEELKTIKAQSPYTFGKIQRQLNQEITERMDKQWEYVEVLLFDKSGENELLPIFPAANLGWKAAEIESNTAGTRDKISATIEGQALKACHARHLLLRIHQTLGRRWGRDVLKSLEMCGSCFSRLYKKLLQIESLNSPALDSAHLNYLVQSHNSTPLHPNVVIEGGGPNGLMMAIKGFMAGANITLLEQRLEPYSRAQIVRLDPVWMYELKFFLGEEYLRLFDPDTGHGKVQADGSGHIQLKCLEQALKNCFDQLIALAGNERHCRFLPNKVIGCKLGDAGSPCTVTTHPVNSSNPASIEHISADILICAGGRGSVMRDQFFNHTLVTEEKYYGVATWEGEAIQNKEINTFPSFKGSSRPTCYELMTYVGSIKRELDPISGTLGKTLSMEARIQLQALLGESQFVELGRVVNNPQDAQLLQRYRTEFKESEDLNKMQRMHADMLHESQVTIEQRCFENRKAIYLAMEIPSSLHQWMEVTRQTLEDLVSKQQLTADHCQRVQQIIREHWFQLIADKQKLNYTVGAKLTTLNRKSVHVFPVAQERNATSFTEVSNPDGSLGLTVVAVGDAATNPHFMTFSGLSSGRVTVDATKQLIDYYAHNTRSQGRAKALSELDRQLQEASNFTLKKGEQFLKPKRLQLTRSKTVFYKQSSDRLKCLCEQSKNRSTWSKPYTIVQTGYDRYRVVRPTRSDDIIVADNGALMFREGIGSTMPLHQLPTFQTFEHLALEKLAIP